MKINEVCERTGISKDNLRFYEKEGLISPDRDRSNNYREYSEDDVVLLEKIKLLRSLEVPVADIRDIISGNLSLEEAASERIGQIETKQKELETIHKLCLLLIKQGTTFDKLDSDVLLEAEPDLVTWVGRSLAKDTADIELTEAGFDRVVAKLMFGAYLLSAVFLQLLGGILPAASDDGSIAGFDRKITALIAVYFLVSAGVGVISVWSSELRMQIRAYIIALLTAAPVVGALLTVLGERRVMIGSLMLMLQAAFFAVLYYARRMDPRFTETIKYPLILAVCWFLLFAFLQLNIYGCSAAVLILIAAAGAATAIGAVCWTESCSKMHRLTLFHAVVTATNSIAVGSLLISLRGRHLSWYRSERD